MLEAHIAWLEREFKIKRDLIEQIEDGKARFFSQEFGKPVIDTTEKDLILAKEKAAEIEAQLTRFQAHGESDQA